MISEKTQQIQYDIQEEAAHSNEVIENLRGYLENDIPMLYETLKQGVQEREQTEELISKQVSDEFANVQTGISDEKRLREEQEEVMLGRL